MVEAAPLPDYDALDDAEIGCLAVDTRCSCEVIAVRSEGATSAVLAVPREAKPRAVADRALGPAEVVGKPYTGVTSLGHGDSEIGVAIARVPIEVLGSTSPADDGLDLGSSSST